MFFVTGIIVDTFADIRDERNHIFQDQRTYCFICGLVCDIVAFALIHLMATVNGQPILVFVPSNHLDHFTQMLATSHRPH